MKLYLSSYKLGDHQDRLLAMVRAPRRMAVITNALDAIPCDAQAEYVRTVFDPIEYFSVAGFDPAPIDLRNYFGRQDALLDELLRYDVIWAVGGNSFLLRRAMRASGFDAILAKLFDADIVYSGWSAGACVAGDSLRAVAPMDEPYRFAPGYPDLEPVWEGLELLPYGIIPHWDSPHREADAAALAIEEALAKKIEFRALRDGDVLVHEHGFTELMPRRL